MAVFLGSMTHVAVYTLEFYPAVMPAQAGI